MHGLMGSSQVLEVWVQLLWVFAPPQLRREGREREWASQPSRNHD